MDRRDWFQKTLALITGGATCIAMPRRTPKTTMAQYDEAWKRLYYPGCYMTINDWRKLQERKH